MFKCSGCGLCCKNVAKVAESVKNIEELRFPYSHDNGVCEKLNEDNTCSVYEDRPLICNVDALIDYYKLNKKSFYELNELGCKELQKNDKK